jgi:hypothetical protein
MRAVSDDAPLLDDLLPWSTAPLRPGRGWVTAPDARALRARWDALIRAQGEAARGALFEATRSRTLHSRVGQLPGHATATGPLAAETGACPDPVRVLHGGFDQQWLIPDHRLIDVARPELWRVADDRQLFAVELGEVPEAPGPAVVVTTLLPDGRSVAGRPGRIRPLYRRPGAHEPNVAPGLLDHLGVRWGRPLGPEELLAWIVATARHVPGGTAVPLPAGPELVDEGLELGRRMLWLHTRGARSGERPKLPGGRRPYVRAPLPARPTPPVYDPQAETLLLGEGRIAPVPQQAWEFQAGGVPVLEAWLERRTATAEPGTLAALGPAGWPQEWTSELLELITVLALLAEVRPRRRELARRLEQAERIGADGLRAAGVLPVASAARRPASVLDHQEEGPGGQFALL